MTEYRLSIGLFDKDSKTQEITTEAARADIARSAADLFGGCSITPGLGAYVHDDGATVFEPCLIVSIYADDADAGRVQAFRDGLKKSLNQEEIYINVYQFASI